MFESIACFELRKAAAIGVKTGGIKSYKLAPENYKVIVPRNKGVYKRNH